MKGHIRRRGSSWCIVYNEPPGDDGRRRRRWRGGFATRGEAEAALDRLQDTLNPRGRPPRTDEEHRRIALIYLAKIAERAESKRTTRGIVSEIAVEESIPRNTLKSWLREARQRGFLNGSTPGRAGAIPGPRLLQQPGHAPRQPRPPESTAS